MLAYLRASLACLAAMAICGCTPSVDVSLSVSQGNTATAPTTTTASSGGAPVEMPAQPAAEPATQPAADSDPDTGKGIIAFSALTFTNPFFTVIADNLKAEAEQQGFTTIIDDADRDVKKQAEQIDSYITRGVSAIVVNPCDRESIGPAIIRANEAGIPVFTCDLQCVAEGAKVTGHIGTDNFQGGRLAGEAMIEALGDAGGKVLIIHFKQANSCVLRVDGFMEVVNEHNEGRETGKIEVVGEVEGGGVRQEGFKATSDVLPSQPELAGIFAINDPSALGAYAALEQAGKTEQVTIIAFDGQLDGKQAIKEGKIYADPIQFPDQMGRRTVEKIVKYLNGEEFEEFTLIPTELYKQADALKDSELQ